MKERRKDTRAEQERRKSPRPAGMLRHLEDLTHHVMRRHQGGSGEHHGHHKPHHHQHK